MNFIKSENKQLVHIASEAIVLLGITYYFSSKNKKLLGHIEELSHRLEEQEDHIEKLENSMQQINQKYETLIQQVNNGFMQIGQTLNSFDTQNQHKQPSANQIPAKQVTQSKKVKKSSFTNPPRVVLPQVDKPSEKPLQTPLENLDEESDSDLDGEITNELSELTSSDNI